jgi:hypothetical protein
MEKGLTRLSLLALLIVCVACSDEKSALHDQQFVEFYAEVAKAQRSAPDSAAAVDSALAVAKRNGITKEDLVALRQRFEQKPTKWVEIWERIVHELKE